MKLGLVRLTIACVCAAFLIWTHPAGAIIYDFDNLSAGDIHGQDNWVDLDVANDKMEVQANPKGGSTHPCQGMCLTMYGGTQVFVATRNNDANWSFDLSGATKFVLGAPWVTDYGATNQGYGAEFRIVNSTTGKGIGFGFDQRFTGAWAGYVDTAAGVSQSSKHTTGHAYQDTGPWTGYASNQRIDFRLEVDLTANGGEGGATLYRIRRYAGETTWSVVPTTTGGLQNIDLQLATQGANITAADQLYAMIGCRNVAQDSLIVSIPSGTMTVETFLDKNLDGVKNGSDEVLSGWAYNVAGPCDCGVYGESPWSGATDGSGQAVIAGGTGTMPGLEDGSYATTVTRQPYYTAAGGNPASVSVAAGAANTNADFGFRPILGDANVDGTVNLSDFTILKAGFGSAGAWANANFNEDTVVNLSDFTILKAEFGESHPDKTGGAAVPEPASAIFLATAALAVLGRRRRK